MTVPLTRAFVERVAQTGDGFCLPPEGEAIRIYPSSPQPCGDSLLFLFRTGEGRQLGCVTPSRSKAPEGMERRTEVGLADGSLFLAGPLSHENAGFLRSAIPSTSAIRIGSGPSFGLGDRLGLAGPAHLRAIRGTGLFPVLAQQSIRELERTARSPEEVMDCASFAAFAEGYADGFAADGDHLKTTADIDRVLAAGFTFFTFDPGDHVDNDADHLEVTELSRRLNGLPWDRLETTRDSLLRKYADRPFRLADGSSLQGTRTDVQRATVKYGRVVAQLRSMFEHLSRHAAPDSYDVEISVDETEAVTTPFEHFLLISEFGRLGIRVDSLAPRFVGRFEKGVDFRGDLNEFGSQFARHVAVRDTFGGYRLSLHSGSDKFSIYPLFARLGGERIHVKTAGTSYLEALRALIQIDSTLFREIFEFSRGCYAEARASYHVSADLSRVPATPAEDPQACDEELRTNEDVRQVLHVAFGDVLTNRCPDGTTRFRKRLLAALESQEETHFRCLEEHFERHFEALRT